MGHHDWTNSQFKAETIVTIVMIPLSDHASNFFPYGYFCPVPVCQQNKVPLCSWSTSLVLQIYHFTYYIELLICHALP